MTPSLLIDPLQDAATTTAAPRLRAAATKKQAASKTKKAVKKKAKKKVKKLPVCTKKDLKKSKKKRRKCRVVKKKASPTGPVNAPPVTTPVPDAWPTDVTGGTPPRTDGLRTYAGVFGAEQATRLLFRAGFGPKPGQAEEFASIGLEASVERLMNPGAVTLSGPAPSGTWLNEFGGQLKPSTVYGHGHLAWLDRMVRSSDQLGERMAFILHDWFPVHQDNTSQSAMQEQTELLRRSGRGSMRQLLQDLTVGRAMLEYLNGLYSYKTAPNENYGRELMELFALGADRGAYTEDDVKEMARALTGWTADWTAELGRYNYRFDKTRWDAKEKVFFKGTSYERRGAFKYDDAVNAVVDHPLHPSFVVLKLWSYFIPTAPTAITQAELEALYRSSGEQLAPLLRAILLHPDLHAGASMTKSPVLHVAGMLRARGVGLTTNAWVWYCSNAGQALWFPPNVAGWNDRAWLNTSSFSARWDCAVQLTRDVQVQTAAYTGSTETPEGAVAAALAFWGNPVINNDVRGSLLAFATKMDSATYGNAAQRRALRINALRMIIANAPDYQVS